MYNSNKELENKVDLFFDKYVPEEGMALTAGGQLMVSWSQMRYELFNNGLWYKSIRFSDNDNTYAMTKDKRKEDGNAANLWDNYDILRHYGVRFISQTKDLELNEWADLMTERIFKIIERDNLTEKINYFLITKEELIKKALKMENPKGYYTVISDDKKRVAPIAMGSFYKEGNEYYALTKGYYDDDRTHYRFDPKDKDSIERALNNIIK